MFGYLLTGVSLGFYAAVSPGPLQTFLLAEALKNGWKHTLPAALSPLLSDVLIVPLILLVLTQAPDRFLVALRIVGGGFILFLAWDAWKSARAATVLRRLETPPGGQSLWKAALMNLLNPNPYVFWSVVAGPILLEGWRLSPVLGGSFVGGFYGPFIALTAVLIVIFATARNLGATLTRRLGMVSAVALAIFGVYQIWLGIISW
ncbi:MAG TPA: lysine transporter LysE [Anaerolineae bacterium]|nr:lysine transporter LysE [Anaerolineae bacterium]